MISLGKKTRARLEEFSLPVKLPLNERVYGMEVGDDRKDESRSATKLAAALVAQEEVIQMVTSEEDTAISTKFYNFCEVTSFVPCAKEQSFDYARRVGDFSNLGFSDSVILRIIMDVSKGDMSHSSTPVGKMTLLGSRVETPRAEHRLTWMLASFFQDAMLRTQKATDPKYLPSIMGGAGVPVLFDRPENLLLFVKGYRGGKYSRIYGTATAELESCLSQLEVGKAASPVLCLRLRDKQDYLHGTYAEKVVIPAQILRNRESGNLPDPIYMATGGANRTSNVEARLVRSRRLVTRTQAERDAEHHIRLEMVLKSYWNTVPLADYYQAIASKVARSKFEMALSANSALQALMARKAGPHHLSELLGDAAYQVISTGERDFTYEHALWIFNGGKSETYSIKDLSTSEDMFIREEVAMDESFRVNGIPLEPIVGRVIQPTMTKAKVGLYEISSTQEEWCDNKIEALRNAREKFGEPIPRQELINVFVEDREWVNDDTLLIQKCLNDTAEMQQTSTAVVLVSNDKKLGYQMANTTQCTVYRLLPSDYIGICYHQGVYDTSTDLPLDTILKYLIISGRRIKPRFLYIDKGSVASQSATLEVEDGEFVQKHLIEARLDDNGKRTARYRLTKTSFPTSYKGIRHDPLYEPKKYRFASRPPLDSYKLSFNSEAGSWRARSASDYSA